MDGLKDGLGETRAYLVPRFSLFFLHSGYKSAGYTLSRLLADVLSGGMSAGMLLLRSNSLMY